MTSTLSPRSNDLLARRSILPRRFCPTLNAAEQKASSFVLVLCANKSVQFLLP